jgi:hypothetical protein
MIGCVDSIKAPKVSFASSGTSLPVRNRNRAALAGRDVERLDDRRAVRAHGGRQTAANPNTRSWNVNGRRRFMQVGAGRSLVNYRLLRAPTSMDAKGGSRA